MWKRNMIRLRNWFSFHFVSLRMFNHWIYGSINSRLFIFRQFLAKKKKCSRKQETLCGGTILMKLRKLHIFKSKNGYKLQLKWKKNEKRTKKKNSANGKTSESNSNIYLLHYKQSAKLTISFFSTKQVFGTRLTMQYTHSRCYCIRHRSLPKKKKKCRRAKKSRRWSWIENVMEEKREWNPTTENNERNAFDGLCVCKNFQREFGWLTDDSLFFLHNPVLYCTDCQNITIVKKNLYSSLGFICLLNAVH